MSRDEIDIRIEGRVGRLTLNRPKALNALTYDMVMGIEAALDAWKDDDRVACVVIDAKGDKAFCAGGDLAQMYETGLRGDYDYGRRFWRDEYRVNAKVFDFPKPYIALMHGFVMGGGVGVSCHGSHRVVCESTRIAMPECAIGLVPDVGGSLLLAHAPGRLGEYLAATSTRMDASDALLAGFADYYIPRDRWRELTEALVETGDWSVIDSMAEDPPDGRLMALRDRINVSFAGASAADIWRGLGDDDFAAETKATIAKNCPISVACAVELVRRVRGFERIQPALDMEFRFTYRSASDGDFIEGIRALIIDKDRNPQWSHADVLSVPHMDVVNMLRPLGDEKLTF